MHVCLRAHLFQSWICTKNGADTHKATNMRSFVLQPKIIKITFHVRLFCHYAELLSGIPEMV